MSAGGRIALEGPVGRKRRPCLASRRRKACAVLEELDLARGRGGNLRQMVFDARQVEVAGATLRESEAGQHRRRNSDDELETAILGLDESLQNDLGREISAVGAGELVHEDDGRDERE